MKRGAKKAAAPNLGPLADLLYRARQERYAAQKKVNAMKDEERALETKLRAGLLELEGMTVGGRKARVTLALKQVPQVANWDALYAHVAKTGEWELLSRSVNAEAIRERAAKKVRVPGVQLMPVQVLSVEKL